MKRIYGIVSVVALCFVASPLQAQGILLVQKETRGGKTTTNQIQIDKNALRAESSADQTAVTYDAQKQLVRQLNLAAKTYQEMSKADLDQMKQQMDSAMAQLQNLPPAQRQMLEQMMQGRGMPGMPGMAGMAAAAAPKPVFRASGTDKVGNWSCTKYEGYVNQQKTVEVCAADPKTFNLSPADFDIARQLTELVKSFAPESTDRLVVNGSVQDQGYAGIALRRTTFSNGAIDTVTEITELRREIIPASTFEVPAGFRKEASPGARGAR